MSAADSLGVAASAATIIQTALELVPPGRRRRWSGRHERKDAYLAFQRAALDVGTWAAYLPTLELVASNRLTELVYMPTVMREIVATRDAVAEFVGTFVDVRLVGNPGPRRAAEDIAVLVAELFGTVPTGRPFSWQRPVISRSESFKPAATALRRTPLLAGAVRSVRKRENGWQRSAQAFEDCQRALGIAHRDFSLAAQRDLGYGHRWWQFWRPVGSWPSGWPGPDVRQLIEQARHTWRAD